MSKRAFLAAALAMTAAGPVRADGGKELRREVMDNGAVILVKEDHNMPVVTIQAWFPVGSTTEGENLGQGLSHFVEHMIFKGTDKQAPGDFARAVKASGGSLNAYTSFDRTVFHCTVRSERFDTMLDSFGDVIMHSKMDPAEATKEQQVIVNELKMYEDDPNRIIQYTFNETAWRVHPARHPIGGYVEQFLKLKPEDVGTYFRRWYAPNDMIFVVVGDVDSAAAMSAIRKLFGGWARKALPPIVLPEEPRQEGTRRETRSYAVAGASSGARLKIGWTTTTTYDEDTPALDMAALVLGHGESSRLNRVLKSEKSLVLSAYANNDTPTWRGHFGIGIALLPKFLEAAEAEVLAQVAKLKEELVSDAELAKIRAAVLAYNVIGRQDVMSQADTLGRGEMFHGNPLYEDLYVEKLKAVTPEDIRRVVRKYLVPATMTVATVVPRAPGGEEHSAAGGVKATFEPHIEEFTLSNGMRVVVRKNPNSASFAFTIAFMAGSRLEPSDKPGVANLACDMLLRGTTSRTAAQIAEEINATGGSIKVQGGRNTLLLNAEMLTQDFDKALELAADILTNPALSPSELENVKGLTLAKIDSMQREAVSTTSIRFHKSMYGDHPYSRIPQGTAKSVAAATPDDLRAVLAQFVHPGNCVVSVVGDLDAAAVKAALEKRFASFKKRDAALPEVKPPSLPEEGIRDDMTDTTLKMGVAIVGFPTVDMKHDDRWALQVLEKVLGGMGGRVWDAVREKKNLAYMVWASNVTMYERGYFQVGVTAQGINITPAIDVLMSEVQRVCDEPITAEELESAKNSVIGEMLIENQKNASQSQQLALDEIYGLGAGNLFEAPKKIDKVTAADVQAVAKKYLDAKKAVIAVTRPGK
ncbi:MAG: insulinase family protein [Planctomycetes bacterium]|nr:insulinase family protein [Planctomycetota bacterium]